LHPLDYFGIKEIKHTCGLWSGLGGSRNGDPLLQDHSSPNLEIQSKYEKKRRKKSSVKFRS
jgi:hypothetical protein